MNEEKTQQERQEVKAPASIPLIGLDGAMEWIPPSEQSFEEPTTVAEENSYEVSREVQERRYRHLIEATEARNHLKASQWSVLLDTSAAARRAGSGLKGGPFTAPELADLVNAYEQKYREHPVTAAEMEAMLEAFMAGQDRVNACHMLVFRDPPNQAAGETSSKYEFHSSPSWVDQYYDIIGNCIPDPDYSLDDYWDYLRWEDQDGKAETKLS